MKKLILIPFLLLFFCTPFNSQDRRPRQTKPQSAATTGVQFDTHPFDIAVSRLPPNYWGHSFGDIFSILEKRDPQSKKGEFETTDAYRQRIANSNQVPLFGNVKPTDLLAFALPSNDEQLTASYNADKQKFHIILQAYRNENRDDPQESAVYLWRSKTEQLKSYTARTSLRKPISIKVIRNSDAYLTFNQNQLSKWQPAEPSDQLQLGQYENNEKRRLEAFVSIPLSRAPAAKANLRALIVCIIGKAPVFKSEDREEPTIDDPTDIYNQTFSFNIILNEIWLYDGTTGEVFYKFNSVSNTDKPLNDKIYYPSQVDVKAKILKRFDSADSLKGMGLRGEITLRVVLLGNGQVGEVKVVKSSNPALHDPAIRAAKKIVFEPAQLDNKPVSQLIEVSYTVEVY